MHQLLGGPPELEGPKPYSEQAGAWYHFYQEVRQFWYSPSENGNHTPFGHHPPLFGFFLQSCTFHCNPLLDWANSIHLDKKRWAPTSCMGCLRLCHCVWFNTSLCPSWDAHQLLLCMECLGSTRLTLFAWHFDMKRVWYMILNGQGQKHVATGG